MEILKNKNLLSKRIGRFRNFDNFKKSKNQLKQFKTSKILRIFKVKTSTFIKKKQKCGRPQRKNIKNVKNYKNEKPEKCMNLGALDNFLYKDKFNNFHFFNKNCSFSVTLLFNCFLFQIKICFSVNIK